jgi:hypothetical protein
MKIQRKMKAALPHHLVADPHGKTTMDKIERYGWEIIDKPGRYQKISKTELNVDPDYQRDRVRQSRVTRIAAKWSWVQFGCLLVAFRPDGTYWVFDGQHRKLAADCRSDIDLLPCIVFSSPGPVLEARWFLSQTDRGNITMFDKFKALIAQNDETALAVKTLIEASRYTMSLSPGKHTVRCPGLLTQWMRTDPEATRTAWAIAVSIADGEPMSERALAGLIFLQRHLTRYSLPDLESVSLRPFVNRLTFSSIIRSVAQTAEFYGRGGVRVYGEAVLRLLNKGRRNKIPSLIVTHAENDNEEETDAE